MSKDDIKVHIQKRDRGVSVEETIAQASKEELDSIIIVGIKNDEVYVGYSLDSVLEVMGALSYAQSTLYNEN